MIFFNALADDTILYGSGLTKLLVSSVEINNQKILDTLNMKKMYELIVFLLNIPRLLPAISVYLTISVSIRSQINIDMEGGGIFALVKYMSLYKHWRNIFYYRIGNVKYFIQWLCPEEHSISIPASTPIGTHLVLVHAINSFINAESIGDNFKCYQNVTIGSNKNKRPVIGNNVTLYTSSIVIGNICIGNNVEIGAGAVVTKSVPDNCVVIGNPARIIKLDGGKVNILL